MNPHVSKDFFASITPSAFGNFTQGCYWKFD